MNKPSTSMHVQRQASGRSRDSNNIPYRRDVHPYQHGVGRSGYTTNHLNRGSIQNPSYPSWKYYKYNGFKPNSYNGPRRERAVHPLPTLGGPAKLIISNLDFGVTGSDIYDLFVEFGPLKKAYLRYDGAGRPLGTADVIYKNRMDAITAMKHYNGVTLDGSPMRIQLAPPKGPVLQHDFVGGSSRPRAPFCRFNGRGAGGSTHVSATQIRRRGAHGFTQGSRYGTHGSPHGFTQGTPPVLTAEDLDAEMDAYLSEMKKEKSLPANLGKATENGNVAIPAKETEKKKTPGEEIPILGVLSTDEEDALLEGETLDDDVNFLDLDTCYEDDLI